MKKKIKKIVIFLLILGILAGATAGGVYGYQAYRRENLTAEVVYVSNLNWGWYEDEDMTSEGNITNDYSQMIYTHDKTVKEVLVEEGDSVDVGTPLLVYDTTQEEIELEMQQLEVQGIDNDIILAKRELEKLRKITPVPDNYYEQNDDDSDDDDSDDDDSDDDSDDDDDDNQTGTTAGSLQMETVIMQIQKKNGDAYNYIDTTAKPYTGEGTPEEPFRFLCTPECYVTGAYLNTLVKNEQAAAFEIWSGNSKDLGNLLSCWTVDGSDMTAVEEDSKWLVSTQEIMEEEEPEEEEPEEEEPEEEEEEEEEEEPEEEENGSYEDIYTVSELRKAIEEKESELEKLDIDKQKAELELEKQQREVEKGMVVSTIKGVVKTVGDMENPPMDGSPFMEVLGSVGLYVQGNISELLLDQVRVGQTVTVSSWNSGQTYRAVISEISDYPSEGGWYGWGEGNTNVSYYQYTAYIEKPKDLNIGDYVAVSISGDGGMNQSNSLYIEKAYVREENGRYYVLKAGEDDRLVKQYVQTGRTIYGYAIEIKAGLSESDRIAFPYGKTAKEGIRAVESQDWY